MADWGMRVSKEGFDVKTCADSDLVMSSSFNMLKTSSVGTTSGSVAHGLSYVPIFMATEQINGTTLFVGQQITSSPVVIDSTYIYAMSNITNAGTIHYYIFYDQSI